MTWLWLVDWPFSLNRRTVPQQPDPTDVLLDCTFSTSRQYLRRREDQLRGRSYGQANVSRIWLPLGCTGGVYVHQHYHSDVVDQLFSDYGASGNILWRNRSQHRTFINDVYDRLHSTVHPGFMGDRHVGFSQGCQYWRRFDGRFWYSARTGGSPIRPRPGFDHR